MWRCVMRTADLEYNLPPDRIATEPVTPRDSARLMVVDRADPSRVKDMRVRDLPGQLRAGDVLVFNTTRVLPARFFGRRIGSGGKVEGLYLVSLPEAGGAPKWVVLLKGKHVRPGVVVALDETEGGQSGYSLRVVERREPGGWVVDVEGPRASTGEVLDRVGHVPLPPYIVKARQQTGFVADETRDRERYQTVYAAEAGSVAAPTAGLHFTPELLEQLERMGVERVDVLLHVGAGTFKPVETEIVEDHPMHSEWCSMSRAAVERVQRAKREGRRVIAVGTTAARTLEAYAAAGETPEYLETRLLITPGYRFAWVDGMLTNFHLPRSTLMAMVAALFAERGVERLKGLYERAIREGYRFYSYGDAMVVV